MKKLLCILFSFLLNAAYANTHFCTHSNTTIEINDRMEDVRQACGQPTVEKSSQVPQDSQRVVLQQWFYTSEPDTIAAKAIAPGVLDTQTQGVALTDDKGILFSFLEGRLVEINHNGQKHPQIACGGANQTVALGFTMTQIKQACGEADFYSTSQAFTQAPPNQPVVTWTYDNGPYKPATELIFIDGKLTSIKHGN